MLINFGKEKNLCNDNIICNFNLKNFMNASSIEKINLELFLYGFSVLTPHENKSKDNYLSNFQREMKYLKINNSKENKNYIGGDFLKIESREIFLNSKYSHYKNFHNSNIKILNLLKKSRGFCLDSIFRTFDTKDSKHIAQQTHFDRIPTLKFMLYVNDINESNGAFCLSPSSHNWVNQNFGKFRTLSQSRKYAKLSRSIPQSILNKLEPIEGKAGTLIIFNTNCVHNQGKVHEGSCKIARAHYRKKFLKLNFI